MRIMHSTLRRIAAFCLLFSLVLLSAQVPDVQAHGDKREDKAGILLVSFGTSVPEAKVSFEKIDAMVKKRYPDVAVRWAYTSKIIRHKLAKEGEVIPSPAEALAKMADENFTEVVVQSLHVIPGEEYHSLVRTAHAFQGMPKGIKRIFVGYPLLSTNDDLETFAKTLLSLYPAEKRDGAALVLMGHGTHHPADVVYPALQYHFARLDPSVVVGTVEGFPTLEDVQSFLKEKGYKKATLLALMSVAGDHARNDMAGDEDDSWKSVLEKDGIACETVLHGLAELPPIAELWLQRLDGAMAHIKR